MNIFYLNPKGPTGMPLDKVEIGDVCILQRADELLVWVQDKKSVELLNHGIVTKQYSIGVIPGLKPQWAKIYSYDGVKKRFGDKIALLILSQRIEDDDLQQLFTNALNILEYKEDTIDANCYLRVLCKERVEVSLKGIPTSSPQKKDPPQPTVVSQKKEELKVEITSKKTVDKSPQVMQHQPHKYRFFDYLDEQCQDTWNFFYKKEFAIRDIFTRIKNNHKANFSAAFRRFTKDFPDLNIYSLKEEKKAKPYIETKPIYTREPGFDFLYQSLENRGFVQISNKMWKDKNGKTYVINIHEA